MNKKELKKAIKEVKKYMGQYEEPKKANKSWLIGVGITVVAVLIALILWIRTKNDEDIEEYYEYFDDEMEDELEDEELYGELEENSILEDDVDELEDDIEYVELRKFEGIEEDDE